MSPWCPALTLTTADMAPTKLPLVTVLLPGQDVAALTTVDIDTAVLKAPADQHIATKHAAANISMVKSVCHFYKHKVTQRLHLRLVRIWFVCKSVLSHYKHKLLLPT